MPANVELESLIPDIVPRLVFLEDISSAASLVSRLRIGSGLRVGSMVWLPVHWTSFQQKTWICADAPGITGSSDSVSSGIRTKNSISIISL